MKFQLAHPIRGVTVPSMVFRASMDISTRTPHTGCDRKILCFFVSRGYLLQYSRLKQHLILQKSNF